MSSLVLQGRTLLRALLGGVFLLSAGLKLFDLDLFELYLFSLELFSFDLCGWIARLVVGVELGLGVALVIGYRERKTTLFTLFLLLLFSLWLGWRIALGDQQSCHCMGAIVEMDPIRSLGKNLLLSLPLLYLCRHPKGALFPLKRGWMILLLLASLLAPTLLFPPDCWYRIKGSPEELRTEPFGALMQEVEWSHKRGIILLLSTECPYCQKAMQKLASMVERHTLPHERIYALFLRTSEEMERSVNEFLDETKGAVGEWVSPSPRTLLSASGGALPLIILYDGSRVVAEYNYRTLDEEAICNFLLGK